MKRDMDLIRQILLYVESEMPSHESVFVLPHNAFSNVSYDVVASHLEIMVTANLLMNGSGLVADDYAEVRGITSYGYDYLDAVRDDELWRRTKDAASKAGGFTIDVLKQVAVGLIKT